MEHEHEHEHWLGGTDGKWWPNILFWSVSKIVITFIWYKFSMQFYQTPTHAHFLYLAALQWHHFWTLSHCCACAKLWNAFNQMTTDPKRERGKSAVSANACVGQPNNWDKIYISRPENVDCFSCSTLEMKLRALFLELFVSIVVVFCLSSLVISPMLLCVRCHRTTIANCNIQLKIEWNSTLAENVYYKLEITHESAREQRKYTHTHTHNSTCTRNVLNELNKTATSWNKMCLYVRM